MKLMEAGTVFLIIGGVLLGPIEGMLIGGSLDSIHADCIVMTEDQVVDPKCRPVFEPTGETCARAMREIGAFLAPPSLPPGFRMEDEKDEKAVRPGDKWRLIGGEKVLCIPAPSGLVR